MADITTMSFYYSGSGTPGASLGGAFSGIAVPNNTKQNLFPNVTSEEAGRGLRQFRCVYLRAGNFSYSELRLFLSKVGTPSRDTQVFLGLGVSAVNVAEPAIDKDTTAPEGVVFVLPNDELNAIKLPDMPANSFKSVWVQRVVNANALGFLDDYARLQLTGVQR